MARSSNFDAWRDQLLSEHVNQLSPKPVETRRFGRNATAVAQVRLDGGDDEVATRVGSDFASNAEDDHDLTLTASHRVHTDQGELWLEGNALLCECPSCSAPMTVRIWLELADCWRCSSSIALSEEQVRQAQRIFADSNSVTSRVERQRLPVPSLEPALHATAVAEPVVSLPDCATSRTRKVDGTIGVGQFRSPRFPLDAGLAG